MMLRSWQCSLLLYGLIGVAFVGCDRSNSSSAPSKPQPSPTEATANAPEGVRTTPEDLNSKAGSAPETSAAQPIEVAYEPPSRSGFIGDQRCADCHDGICESYAEHPMGRSIVPVDLEAERQLMRGDEIIVGEPRHHYLISIRDDQLWHTERWLDENGDVVAEQGEPIRYVVGSGQRAFAYLAARDNLMLMSPLNWYSEDAVFDFSPSHSLDDPRRFSRRVSDDCLSCHAGRVNELDGLPNRYAADPFLQAHIGCENCHGPGEQHADFHEFSGVANNGEKLADVIVNPAKLDHQRQEAICYQCHLHAPGRVLRPGRSQFDFRPGDRLEDVWATMVAGTGIDSDGDTKAVSHVQQMHASKCFQMSDNKMGCITCHDPHGLPEESERVSFYRARCLTCHDVEGCTAPAADRQSIADACVTCHMPKLSTKEITHISQTDHRVLRHLTESEPPPATDTAAKSSHPSTPASDSSPQHLGLKFFWNVGASLPEWERQRALGMGLWLAGSHGAERPPLRIAELLTPLTTAHPEDGAMQTVMGAFWSQYQSLERARQYYELALADDDARENAQNNLLTTYYLLHQWPQAEATSQELLKVDPENARVYALRADILANMSRDEEAMESAEAALRFNPSLSPVRQWLIDKYRKAGRGEDAARHEQLSEQIRAAASKSP